MADEQDRGEVLRLTTKIVSAHVSNNAVPLADLPALIRTVYEALVIPEGTPPPQKPAVPIKKSVTPDYIVCLEDGSKHKMLKRHADTIVAASLNTSAPLFSSAIPASTRQQHRAPDHTGLVPSEKPLETAGVEFENDDAPGVRLRPRGA